MEHGPTGAWNRQRAIAWYTGPRVLLGLRKGICKGNLGGVSMPSQGKLLPAIGRGFLE